MLHDAVYSRPERSNVNLLHALTIGHSELRHFIPALLGILELSALQVSVPHVMPNVLEDVSVS